AAGPLLVDRGHEDLACAEFDALASPRDGVAAAPLAAVVGVGLPRTRSLPLRLYRQDDALRAEHPGGLADELRPSDRGRVDRDLVGTGAQEVGDVFGRPDAAADRQRHEDLGRGPLDDVEEAVAVIGAGD